MAFALDVEVVTVADPTSGDFECAIVDAGAAPAESAFVAGTWGAWSASTQTVVGTSGLIGSDSQDHDVSGLGVFDMWARFTVGAETWVGLVGSVTVI